MYAMPFIGRKGKQETMIIAINANAMLKTTRYPEYAYMYM